MNSFKFDTHVHTFETSPCGIVLAANAVRYYKKVGYNGVVITDHYNADFFSPRQNQPWEHSIDEFLKGFRNAHAEGIKTGLIVLLGIEIRLEESIEEYLVYGFDEDFLYNNPELYKLDFKTFSNFARSNGLLVYQAHPFRRWFKAAPPLLLDGMEVYNGNPRHNSHNDRALEYAEKYGLRQLSGSDFHHPEDLARGGVILPEAPKNISGFKKLLFESRIIDLIKT